MICVGVQLRATILFTLSLLHFKTCAAQNKKASSTKWFGDCGISRFPDAGEGSSPPGRRATDFIVSGTDARHGEFPWMVAIYEDGFFACGGALIDDNRILTAAHCVNHRDDGDHYTVVLGDNTRDESAPERRVYAVHDDDITIHEEFREETKLNDIAIMYLPVNLTVTDYIRPVCSPDADRFYPFLPAIVSGWGYTVWLGPDLADILQYANVTIVDPNRCRSDFEYTPDEIHDSNWCAYDPSLIGKDACTYDSGGPLVYKRDDGVFELVGLVSWGEGCGDAGFPGVYTNVLSFLQWIENNKLHHEHRRKLGFYKFP